MNFDLQATDILLKSVYETMTDRALIVRLHNGGSKITPGVSKFISVPIEEHTDRVKPIRDDWQKIAPDIELIRIVSKLMSDKTLILETATMEPGQLKRSFDLAGIQGSIIFEIFSSENSYYFVIFSSVDLFANFINQDTLAVLEIRAQKLRNLFSKSKKKIF